MAVPRWLCLCSTRFTRKAESTDVFSHQRTLPRPWQMHAPGCADLLPSAPAVHIKAGVSNIYRGDDEPPSTILRSTNAARARERE